MKRNVERMRYKNDKLASGLCVLAIALDIVYFVRIYSSPTIVPDYSTGIDVIINILFMLVVFWAGEQLKVYERKWAVGILVLAAFQTARLFWLPEKYHALGQLTGGSYALVRVSLAASAAALAAAGVISVVNSTALRRHLASVRQSKEQ